MAVPSQHRQRPPIFDHRFLLLEIPAAGSAPSGRPPRVWSRRYAGGPPPCVRRRRGPRAIFRGRYIPCRTNRATRCSLGVRASSPVRRTVRGRAPAASSSVLARSTSNPAPHRAARSIPSASGARASRREPARRSVAPRSTTTCARSSLASSDPSRTLSASASRSQSTGTPDSPTARAALTPARLGRRSDERHGAPAPGRPEPGRSGRGRSEHRLKGRATR